MRARMCAHVHASICACVHVCKRACVHVCMCACTCVHVCMCACVHVCSAFMHVCMCAYHQHTISRHHQPNTTSPTPPANTTNTTSPTPPTNTTNSTSKYHSKYHQPTHAWCLPSLLFLLLSCCATGSTMVLWTSGGSMVSDTSTIWVTFCAVCLYLLLSFVYLYVPFDLASRLLCPCSSVYMIVYLALLMCMPEKQA